MSQQSLGTTLHPVLQAALSSRDVELEAELAKYRHHKAVSISSLAPQIRQAQRTQTPNLALATAGLDEKKLVLNRSDYPGEASQLAATAARDASLHELTRPRLSPNDYLASSKALLQNLNQTQTPRKLSLVTVLLTAWGATLALLMLAGVAVAYLVMHLSNPSRPSLANAPASSSPEPSVANLERPSVTPPAPASSKPAIAPDLTAKEFAPLDLSHLSRLRPSSGAPQASPTTSTNQTTIDTGKARAAASVAPPLPKQALSPDSTQSSQPTTAAEPVASPSSQGRYYYVLTNFTNNQSLQQAQRVVKDAHVRSFANGKRVQVGAFYDSQSANRLVQKLKRQGVPATVLKP